jgi:hypothetical protein
LDVWFWTIPLLSGKTDRTNSGPGEGTKTIHVCRTDDLVKADLLCRQRRS